MKSAVFCVLCFAFRVSCFSVNCFRTKGFHQMSAVKRVFICHKSEGFSCFCVRRSVSCFAFRVSVLNYVPQVYQHDSARSVENVLSDAEIAQLGRHSVSQQNVLWLQVAVENLVPVEMGHRGTDLPRDDEDAAKVFGPCA